MYRKEIIYMGLYKDGERLGSAGFLKVEKRDKEGSLCLAVKNVPRSIEGKFPVRYYSGTDWKEMDGIILREGGGQWEKQERDSLEQVRLQITLPGGYLVEGESRTLKPQKSAAQPPLEKPEEELQEKTESGENAGPETRQAGQEQSVPGQIIALEPPREPVLPLVEIKKQEHSGKGRAEKERAEKERPGRIEHISVLRQERPEKRMHEPVQAQKPLMADAFAMEGLKEDKWEQILDTYDAIHPYDDERVYVKLTPKDFIILSSKYQHLVNNSFLLHGFYNYRHVILGKEREYYLGVPGVYYEREKMVAMMFGFEAFECASGRPEDGEFGYYLRKVEL